jgi:hypothetical protein
MVRVIVKLTGESEGKGKGVRHKADWAWRLGSGRSGSGEGEKGKKEGEKGRKGEMVKRGRKKSDQ